MGGWVGEDAYHVKGLERTKLNQVYLHRGVLLLNGLHGNLAFLHAVQVGQDGDGLLDWEGGWVGGWVG